MNRINKDWEYNILGIDNYTKPDKLKIYYDFIIKNHNKLEGDILEIGVFNGKTLLSTALLLKEIGSKKIVYGFDSFSGFPPVYHENDSFDKFFELFEKGEISKSHLDDHKKLLYYKNLFQKNKKITPKNISTSNDFSGVNYDILKEKINHFQLDNIKLVEGDFKDTMINSTLKENKFMSVFLDCDLYESYKISFNFFWEKLEKGAMVYLDEYYSLKFPGARIATNEFLKDKKIKLNFHIENDKDFERWYLIK